MSRIQSRGTAVLGTVLAGLLAVTGCADHSYEDLYAAGEIDVPDDLYATSAVGANHMWAAGYFGAVYRTRDGGESWNKLDALTEKSIYDISFADESHGWAVGRRGFVVYTEDGGDSWTKQDIPRRPARHIFSIHAIDKNTAWAVGDWGGRYFTDDAGKTWQDRSFLISRDHPVFKYLNDSELAAFERGEKVYDDTYLNDVFFADPQNGWMAGEYGITYWTADGGASWERGKIEGGIKFDPVVFPEAEGDLSREQWDELFEAAEILIDKVYLRVRLEGFLTPKELAARDGDTFLADERAESIRDFFENEGVSQDRLKMVNPTPFDQESVDMVAFAKTKVGSTGHATIEIIETPFLFDVKFSNPQNGMIAGLGGVMLRTSDGGRTWKYLETDTKLALFSVALGEGHAVVVGERGQRRVSTDGGDTWARLGEEDGYGTFPADVYGYMRDAVCGSPTRCWIVGENGFVVRSSDGGATWDQVLPPDRRVSSESDEETGE